MTRFYENTICKKRLLRALIYKRNSACFIYGSMLQIFTPNNTKKGLRI